jgi:hypothetical protein
MFVIFEFRIIDFLTLETGYLTMVVNAVAFSSLLPTHKQVLSR